GWSHCGAVDCAKDGGADRARGRTRRSFPSSRGPFAACKRGPSSGPPSGARLCVLRPVSPPRKGRAAWSSTAESVITQPWYAPDAHRPLHLLTAAERYASLPEGSKTVDVT